MKQFVKYGEEKEKAGTNGQIKYIKETICQLEQNEAMSKFNELLGKMAAVQSETTAVKTDSAILGGLANGLAGPAAGIAAYANAERDNAMAEANAAETRRRGQENMRNVNALDANFKSVAKGLNKDIDRIMNKLCDTSSPDKYFSYLNCITKSYTIEPDGTMNIALEISFNKEPELGGMKFVIDGALCLDIKDGDKKVGEAYVCAPGFNELDLSKVGFNAKSDYTVVGISSDSDFDEGKEYTFDIKPVNIWMIEK